MYAKIITELQNSYDNAAEERNTYEITDWKAEERRRFLEEIQREQKQMLLEIGAGAGRDGQFFQEQGLQVICTDLSPNLVEFCRAKGLEAYAMDALHLDFPEQRFDCIFSLNSLLHVPRADIDQALIGIRKLLKPTGLFYLGVYGGHDFEGIWADDRYEPKRFFSFFTDQAMLTLVMKYFELIYFRQVPVEGRGEYHFQSLMLRRKV